MIPRLVTRKAWRAAPAKAITPQAPADVELVVVHYSGMDADEQDRHARCAERVRGIQRFHMTSDQLTPGGASDIAYSWLVCRHGYVFKGRGWGRRPAATRGVNAISVAVCFLGNDSAGRRDVTPAASAALREVVAFVRRNAPNLEHVRGHRDFNPTACPGDELMELVRELDAELGA